MRKEDFEGQGIGVCACTSERARVEVQVMGLYSLNHYHMALKPWANSDFLPSKVDWGRQEVGITLAWGEACFHCSSALLSHTHKHAHTATSRGATCCRRARCGSWLSCGPLERHMGIPLPQVLFLTYADTRRDPAGGTLDVSGQREIDI